MQMPASSTRSTYTLFTREKQCRALDPYFARWLIGLSAPSLEWEALGAHCPSAEGNDCPAHPVHGGINEAR